MTTISEAYTWAAVGAELKTHLKIADSTEDAELELWWTSALEAADHYIDHDFLDDDGNDIDITMGRYRAIKAGLFKWMKTLRNAELGSEERDPALKSQRTDILAETYGSVEEAVASFTHAASVHWWPFKSCILY